ncbi:MAG: hypothetical protein AAB518_00160 [Patescibacteria group bacterium]
MANQNLEEADRFQREVLERVQEIQRMLDREAIGYYRNDRVDDRQDAYENLRGLHTYLKRAYQELDRLLTDIERRPEYE